MSFLESFLDLLKDERWHIFLPMTLTVDIPDDLAADLGAGFQNLGRAALEALAAEQAVGLGKVAQPLRVAVTGRSVGPPLFEPIAMLGRDATLKRIDVALAKKI